MTLSIPVLLLSAIVIDDESKLALLFKTSLEKSEFKVVYLLTH